MLKIYHRVKINKDLLTPDKIQLDRTNLLNPLAKYLSGSAKTTLPAGRCVGVTWNPYLHESAPKVQFPPQEGEGMIRPSLALPFSWSQTDIRMRDSKGREVTVETDLSDYRHKSGGHLDGFKNIHILNKADAALKIEWETLGKTPICGEFVFMIEQENCEC